MKQRILDFVIVLIITFFLGYATPWITDRIFFQVAFPQLIALQDFHWEDFVFKLRPDVGREDRITLINISEGNRLDIARQIELINSYEPRVIGMDVFFNCPDGRKDSANCLFGMDTVANGALHRAIRKSKKFVLSSRIWQTNAAANANYEVYDSLELSDPEFRNFARNGFSNLVSDGQDPESALQCRSFYPSLYIKDKEINSFAVELAMMYDSLKAKKYLSRRSKKQVKSHKEELINFRGNVGSYSYYIFGQTISKASNYDVIDYDDLISGQFHHDLIKDRIILLAYLGQQYLDDPAYKERFYTPLNPTMAGRSLPDMLGPVIHANIISMILNEDGIDQLSPFWDFTVMLIVITLNILLFIYLLKRNSVWYDSLGFIIPVLQIIIISWLRIELLASLNFRLDLENIIYLLAFVTFAVNIYFGPGKKLAGSLRTRINKKVLPEVGQDTQQTHLD